MSSSPTTISRQQVDSLFTNWENRQTCSDQQLHVAIELIQKKQAELKNEIQIETEKFIEGLKARSLQLVSQLETECQSKQKELEDLIKEKQELKDLVSNNTQNDQVDEQTAKKVQEFVNSKTVHNLEKFSSFEIENLKAEQVLRDLKFGKLNLPNACVKTQLVSTSSAPLLAQNVAIERRPRNASFMRLPSPTLEKTSGQPSTPTHNRTRTVSTFSTPQPVKSNASSIESKGEKPAATATTTSSGNGSVNRFSRSFSLIPSSLTSPIKFDELIGEAYQDMRQQPTVSFVSMEYDEKNAKHLKFSKNGKSLSELVEQLTPDNAVHAIVKVCALELDDVVRDRFVAVTFIGENVRQVRRGAITANINHFIDYYGLTVSIHLKDVSHIKEEIIEKLNSSASGMKTFREYKFIE